MIDCKHHNILWDMESIEIRIGDGSPDGEFDEAVEFSGVCLNAGCGRKFIKTFVDPRYFETTNEDMIDVFRESIKNQAYSTEVAKVKLV